MKCFARRCFSLILALVFVLCGLTGGLAATEDYSVSEKLFKQLQAGSGLTGTLTLSLTPAPGREREAYSTTEPFHFDVSYISVREDAATGAPAERRYDVRYMDGEDSRAAATLSLRDRAAYLSSNLLGDGWYSLVQEGQGGNLTTATASLGTAAPGATAQVVGGQNPFTKAAGDLLGRGALPSLYRFFLPLLLQGQNLSSSDLGEAFSAYNTKIDLWIEGYRQNAVLGKLADGTTTMEVDYTIPPSAVKAQLQQMVMDMLADASLLPKLQALLPAQDAELLLNPALQAFYFFAIDSLPLEGDLTISRTVSLKGDTLNLKLRLPLYDKEAGPVEIAYERISGIGDLPDENVVSLDSENTSLRLEYQEYQSLTDVTVYQGTLFREPHGLDRYAVDQGTDDVLSKTLSTAFTLTQKTASGVDGEDRETLSNDYELTLEPLLSTKDEVGNTVTLTLEQQENYIVFPAFKLGLSTVFSSKQAKNAPTSMDVHLTLTGEELAQSLDLTFSGKSAAKWTPEAIDLRGAIQLADMTQEDLNTLMAGTGLRLSACFLPSLHLPEPEPTPDPSGAPAPSSPPSTVPTRSPEAATPTSGAATAP